MTKITKEIVDETIRTKDPWPIRIALCFRCKDGFHPAYGWHHGNPSGSSVCPAHALLQSLLGEDYASKYDLNDEKWELHFKRTSTTERK